jgi:hypothetical protein
MDVDIASREHKVDPYLFYDRLRAEPPVQGIPRHASQTS